MGGYMFTGIGGNRLMLTSRLFVVVVIASLYACKATNPIAKEERTVISINTITVTSSVDKYSSMGATKDRTKIPPALQQALERQLDILTGPKAIDLSIHMTEYFVPRDTARFLFGADPFMNSKITLVDSASGKVLGKDLNFSITTADFDGGNWAVVHSYGTEFDKPYPPMVGLYARKVREWLVSNDGARN